MLPPKAGTTLELPLPGRETGGVIESSHAVANDVLVLFDESGLSLLRYLHSMRLRPAGAEDILQDVFLALFRHLQSGRPRHNLKGWLFQVAHNLALKQRQQQIRRQRTESEWAVIASPIAPAGDPEDVLVEDQRRRRLRSVLQAMPERDRQCLYLRAEGLCYRDIAHVLGVSLGSVAKSVARGIARLSVTDRG